MQSTGGRVQLSPEPAPAPTWSGLFQDLAGLGPPLQLGPVFLGSRVQAPKSWPGSPPRSWKSSKTCFNPSEVLHNGNPQGLGSYRESSPKGSPPKP